MKKLIALLLIISVMLSFPACEKDIKSENLMKRREPSRSDISSEEFNENYITRLGVELFKKSYEEKNILISPLSIAYALAMVQNGAEGETLEQMEALFGTDRETLNRFLYSYSTTLPGNDSEKLSIANSIWIKNDPYLTVNNDFLQTTANYYSADVFKSRFDRSTLKDINNWVSENTKEMIPEILDSIPKDTVMYLINALAFESEWADNYKEPSVRDGIFTTLTGEEKKTSLMYSTEYDYLSDGNTKGVIKYYEGKRYAFAALLHDESVGFSEYVESLTAEKISSLLENVVSSTVITAIPKFEHEYSASLPSVLSEMGLCDAFDPLLCDLSSLGTYEDANLYISDVIHKTYISVAEKGTKAGAATVISVDCTTSADVLFEEPKEVILDRPFVYMLIDCETNTPFFIGAVMSP